MTWRGSRSAGLGLAGFSRDQAAASARRADGEAVPPAPERMAPRPRERVAAALWGERHRQLALASLHRWLAQELTEGRRWPQALGIGDLRSFTREDYRAALDRLRNGVLPDGTLVEISPVFARIDVAREVMDVDRRVEQEPREA